MIYRNIVGIIRILKDSKLNVGINRPSYFIFRCQGVTTVIM